MPSAGQILSNCHLLAIEDLNRTEIATLLGLAESYVALNREVAKKRDTLRGRTLINLFFESSTRTSMSPRSRSGT